MYRRSLADHKTGHTLASIVTNAITKISGVKITHQIFFRFSQVNNDRDLWVVFIRHPYEIITSGYNYHKTTDEWWAVRPGVNLYHGSMIGACERFPEANMSEDGLYQDKLNSMTRDDGLEYEMLNVGRLTVEAMYYWRYYDMPNVLTVKFEDFESFWETVRKIMRFYKIDESYNGEVRRSFRIHNMKTNAKLLDSTHVTNKNRIPFVYKKMWKPRHYDLARKIFPADLLTKFGYTE